MSMVSGSRLAHVCSRVCFDLAKHWRQSPQRIAAMIAEDLNHSSRAWVAKLRR